MKEYAVSVSEKDLPRRFADTSVWLLFALLHYGANLVFLMGVSEVTNHVISDAPHHIQVGCNMLTVSGANVISENGRKPRSEHIVGAAAALITWGLLNS